MIERFKVLCIALKFNLFQHFINIISNQILTKKTKMSSNIRNGKQQSYEEESIEENVGGAGAGAPRNMSNHVVSDERIESGDLPDEYSDENGGQNQAQSREVIGRR